MGRAKHTPARRAGRRDAGVGGGKTADHLAAAVAAHRAGRLDAAAAAYRAILNAQPDHANALHLLGLVAHQQGNQQEALRRVEEALRISPANAAYANSLGLVLLALGRSDEAEAAFHRALANQPTLAEAHNNLGNARARREDFAGAADAYRMAITTRPDYPEAYANLAGALRRLGDLVGAEAAVRQALALRQTYAGALCTLGLIRHDRAAYDEALALYDQALALEPNLAAVRANRATLLLLLGRLEEGFREYEWRWRTSGFTTPRRNFAAPLWDGQHLEKQTILVHAEQGLGSAIQFVRYVPLVATMAGKVVLEAQPPLTRLFASLARPEGAAPITVLAKGMPLPDAAVQVPLMSLPRLFGTTLETVPNAVPYLAADAALRATWRARLDQACGARPRPRVGLVWAGNPNHHNDRNRSIPAMALAPLLALSDLAFIDLQVGAAARQRADLPPAAAAALHPPGGEMADFADTAAIIEELDLVISVDTAAAHLAGALERPVWLLVPYVPEWRWLRERTDTPWYPTMRLFRQADSGDWPGVVTAVVRALSERFR